MSDEHYEWMRKAVELAAKSKSEHGREDPTPAVGAVIVKNGVEIACAYRGQCGAGNHAEKCAIEFADGTDLIGAVVYSTLEPCSRRNAPKIACAQRLVDQGVRTVYIGLYDPNPKIYREGWRILRDAGITLRDFPASLRTELREMNTSFLNQYIASTKNSDRASFDYIHTRAFSIGEQPETITTTWSHAGSGVIHAYADSGRIALARHAEELHEVDDPSAMDFDANKREVTAKDGDVIVFRGQTDNTFAVVKVEQVLSLHRGDDRNELEFTYEIRTL